MKCTNCGSEIAPNQAFCSTCGTPVPRQVNQVQGGPVNQNLGGQGFPPPPPPPRKKGGVPIWAFLITILLIVAIMLGVYFLVLRDSDSDDDSSSKSSSSRKKNNNDDDDDDNKNSSKNNSSKNNTTNNNTNNSSENTTVTPSSNDSSSSYTVAVGNFIVKIPDNYIYETSSDSVAIVDEEETMLIQMWIKEAPYTTVVSKKNELASSIRESGATVANMQEKTVNGTQCLVYEVSESGQNYLYAVIRVNSMYSAVCVLVNADYTTYDYGILEKAVPIAITAEKSSSTTTTTTSPSSNNTTTTNLESKSTINFDKILE